MTEHWRGNVGRTPPHTRRAARTMDDSVAKRLRARDGPPPSIDELKQAAADAVLALFDAAGAVGWLLTVPGTNPTVYIAAGDAETIRTLVRRQASDDSAI